MPRSRSGIVRPSVTASVAPDVVPDDDGPVRARASRSARRASAPARRDRSPTAGRAVARQERVGDSRAGAGRRRRPPRPAAARAAGSPTARPASRAGTAPAGPDPFRPTATTGSPLSDGADLQHPEARVRRHPRHRVPLIAQPPRQRVRPEVLRHHEVGRPGHARQPPESRSCSAALPARIGGLDHIPANTTSSGTSSGRHARTFPSPAASALARTRSSARSFTSTAQIVERRRIVASHSEMGPHPQPRSSRSPPAVGSGACSSSTRVPLSRRPRANTPASVVTVNESPATSRRAGIG